MRGLGRTQGIHVARAIALAGALLAAGCAEFAVVAPGGDDEFEFQGRIAVRYRDEASSGNVSWRHRADADEVLLTTPLGQGVARIVRAAGAVTLTTADGKEHRAADAEALTESVLGFRLPLAGLASWVRGVPASGASGAQRDAEGRIARFEQSGWAIEYLEYAGRLPARMKLSYPGIEIRLAIGEWTRAAIPQ